MVIAMILSPHPGVGRRLAKDRDYSLQQQHSLLMLSIEPALGLECRMNCTLQVQALTGTPKSCLTNHRSQEEFTRNVRCELAVRSPGIFLTP